MRWKKLDVIGPECEVSDTGLVRQKIRFVRGQYVEDALRMPAVDPRGYLYIGFNCNGKQQNKYIHRLVAEAFIPNPKNYDFIKHGPQGRRVNSVDNLSWSPSKTIRKRKYALSAEAIEDIRDLGRARGYAKQLAKKYNVPAHHIYRVARGVAC